MRRRPIILCLLAAAALVGAAVALADPPSTTTAVKGTAESPDAQVGPVVAVNPAAGASSSAVQLATDWRGGVQNPQTDGASGTISGTSGATTWTDHGILPGTAGNAHDSLTGGSPDVAWGPGNTVYAVELGRDVTDPTNPCASGAGLFLDISTNGGATWGTPLTVQTNGPGVLVSDPTIAYSPVSHQIYIAYTKSPSCPVNGQGSDIRLATITTPGSTARMSAVTGSGNPPQFGRPSLAVLPSGGVAVAYYDASSSPGKVDVTTCAPSGASDACNLATPAVVDPAALDPIPTGGLVVHVRPTIAADSTGRVVVAWAESTPTFGWDVYSATSRDSGASFGPRKRVSDDDSDTDQIDPSLAIAPDGRADLAFLDSKYTPGATGYQVAVSASNRPNGNVETWSVSESVESTTITPIQATVPGAPTLGARVGIDEIPHLPGRAWTLVAWTDPRNVSDGTPSNGDVYTTVLQHGSTTPTAADQAMTVNKNVLNTVSFAGAASDLDADPLTYSIVSQGAKGTASIPDPNVPELTYQAPNAETTDQVLIGASDGINQTTFTVSLNIVNRPPVIACGPLSMDEDTSLVITPSMCASDPNNDPISLAGSSSSPGTVTGSGASVVFTPTTGFTGTASIILTASDGIGTSPPATISIDVHAPTAVAVSIVPPDSRAARTDRPVTFRAVTAAPGVEPSKIEWSFGDKGTGDSGPTVSHLFSQTGRYTVSASVGDGPVSTVTVIAQPPPLILRDTGYLRPGTLKLKLQLAHPGTLVVRMPNVHGSHKLTKRMKGGTHTIRMLLPPAAREQGTVVVSVKLTLKNKSTASFRRAILLPAR